MINHPALAGAILLPCERCVKTAQVKRMVGIRLTFRSLRRSDTGSRIATSLLHERVTLSLAGRDSLDAVLEVLLGRASLVRDSATGLSVRSWRSSPDGANLASGGKGVKLKLCSQSLQGDDRV